ncbi:MAG: DUF1533 domain-containing protein [Flavobacterium sp.]|uniref:hemoblobin-interacting domain-containing protein n=1 Tax=Flavobacterium sp. TaxID=239 RepID=UPI0011FC9927|nr:hemoblobin-interacting domain-containing protein [Flavobacterium sp.]RZJ66955.1 MAG: DUF1533 domain-containing protein [Flavobacterium sp.]
MIKKLFYSTSSLRFSISFVLAFFFLSTGILSAQQVIGSFPQMDGGFEGQTTGPAVVLGSVPTGTQRTDWTVQNAAATATINATGGRSGGKYLTFGSAAGTAYRMQSPTAAASAIVNTTAYTVQLYYRIPTGTTAATNIQRGISPDGTTAPGTYTTNNTLPVNGNAWTQVQVAQTSGSSSNAPKYGIGIIRYNTTSTVNVEFDDFVIYAGAADNTAPASAGAATVSNATTSSLDVSWGASASVDGGGYVVVRYAVNPNADNDPNQQGIYAVGNTTTNGTGALVGTIRYTGTGTSFTDNVGLVAGTQYWYKVYTVDKAFNYSTEVSATGLTISSGSLTPPTLTAAAGATVDAAFNVTFTDDAAWRSAITGVNVNGTALTAGYSVASGQIVFTPSASVPASLLQTSGSKTIVVSATGYSTATVTQNIGAGIANKLAITTQPAAPPTNGALLATQPVVVIQDQYGNLTSSTLSVGAAVGAGTWTLGGTTPVTAVSGSASFTNLTATSTAAVTGATIAFSATGLTGVTSNGFNIPVPAPANDNCAGAINLTVDAAAVSGTFAGSSPMTGSTRPDVFFMFTPTVTGTHTITVNNFSVANDKDIYVYSVCPATYSTTTNVVASGVLTDNVSETATATFTAGTSYKILVQDYNSAGGTFSIAVTGPPASLAVTPAALTFANQAVLTSSTGQPFSLSGSALTGAPGVITITAPNANFEVSNNNSTWGATTTVSYTSATLSATNVYVRFAPQTVGAKTGNVTISGGGATTPPTVAVSGTGSLSAPVAALPTNIGTNQFDANWSAQATGYSLDVSLSSTFGTPAQVLNESFTAATFPPTGWTNTGWARSTTNGDFLSTPAAAVGNSNSGTLTTSAVSNPSLLTFYLGRSGNTTAKTLDIEVSTTSQTTGFAVVATYDHNNVPSASYNQYTVDLSAYSSFPNVYIRFVKTSATTSPWRLDDVVVNGLIPSFVTGYNGLAVNGTTQTVSGLAPYTTYYYRVRATSGAEASPNSNTQSVTTLPETVIWNGTSWSNGTGPDFSKQAEIQGAYSTTPNGDFTALKLTLTSGSLTVSSGTNVTVVNDVVNNLAATAFVIENNGSFIQVNDVANTGNATVKRSSAALMRLDYTLWSSPVESQNLLAFSSATTPSRFYTYNSATNEYNTIVPSTNSFDAATGYLIRMPNNHPTTPATWMGTFTGKPHNGAYSVTVANNTYNAVGNPYPSVIDADLFMNANGITEALYFWRKTNNATTTSYATYTLAGGTGTQSNPGDPLNLVPNGFIQTGQGFIARSTSTSLTFNNSMRVSNFDNQFLRASSAERHRIWLNLTNTDGLFSQTMVAYMQGATQGIDAAIDGRFFNDSQNALTSIVADEEFAVQGRSLPFATSDVVPLGFKTETAGNFSISIDHVDGLFSEGQEVFLRDNSNNTVHNLNDATYTFASEAGVFNSRFDIVYDSALSVGDPIEAKSNVIVYKQNQQLVVNSANATMSSVKVYDISGRLIFEQLQIDSSEYKFTPTSANQALLIRVTLVDGTSVIKKIAY